MDEELMWFDNPPRRRSKTRRKPPKGYKSWKAWSAAMRRKKSGGTKMAKRKRRRSSARRPTTTRRRRRVAVAAAAPRRRRRHRRTSTQVASRAGRLLRYRRPNPPSMFRNIPGRLMEGALGAVQVTVGKAGALALPKMVKSDIDMASPTGLAAQVVAALALGWAGSMISPKWGERMLIGGFTAPIESFLKKAKVPIISDALSGQDYYSVGTYPQPQALAAYPQPLSAYEDDMSLYPQ